MVNMTEEFEVKLKGEMYIVAADVDYYPQSYGDAPEVDIIEVFDYDNNVVRTTVDQDEEFVERIIDQLSDRLQEKEYDLD